jgi:hypothetical protein
MNQRTDLTSIWAGSPARSTPARSPGWSAFRLTTVLITLTLIWTGVHAFSHYLLQRDLPLALTQAIQAVAIGSLVTLVLWAACRW